ncbi:MAG: carotenoid oxygenase family protein [Pseudonocardiaceae bacterium]
MLMGFVYDTTTDRSNLTLLDAANLENIAAIHLPDRVPYGFHGNWHPPHPDRINLAPALRCQGVAAQRSLASPLSWPVICSRWVMRRWAAASWCSRLTMRVAAARGRF